MSSRLFAQTVLAALLLSSASVLFAQSTPKQAHVADPADSSFMTQANMAGVTEIRMGQLALQETSNPKVKALAQRIVQDHTEANRKLGALAQAQQVVLLTSPSKDAQATAAAMSGMNGSAFDKAWTSEMIGDHQKAISLFTDEMKKTSDTQLRAFVQATLPTLKAHLLMAQKLKRQLK